jgi:hypothetical protein
LRSTAEPQRPERGDALPAPPRTELADAAHEMVLARGERVPSVEWLQLIAQAMRLDEQDGAIESFGHEWVAFLLDYTHRYAVGDLRDEWLAVLEQGGELERQENRELLKFLPARERRAIELRSARTAVRVLNELGAPLRRRAARKFVRSQLSPSRASDLPRSPEIDGHTPRHRRSRPRRPRAPPARRADDPEPDASGAAS